MYLKYIFVGIALILALLLSVYKLYSFVKKNNSKNHPVYVSTMTGLLLLYVICGLLLIFYVPKFDKLILLLFALSPFIIGKLATYETENKYALFQIICLVLSAVFVVQLY